MNPLDNHAQEQMSRIVGFVSRYRRRFDISPTPEPKTELSGELFGEGTLLLFRQLVTTKEGYGAWAELKSADTRNLVLREIHKALAAHVFDRPVGCDTCVLPVGYAGAAFVTDGRSTRCSFCLAHRAPSLNRRPLADALDPSTTEKIGVTVSGGRDSLYVWWWLVRQFGSGRVVAFNHRKVGLSHPFADRNLHRAQAILKTDLVQVDDHLAKDRFHRNLATFLLKPDPAMLRVALCAGCRFGISGRLFLEAQQRGIAKIVNGASDLELVPFKGALLAQKGDGSEKVGLLRGLSENPGYLEGDSPVAILLDDLHCHVASLANEQALPLYPTIQYFDFYRHIAVDPAEVESTVVQELDWQAPEDDKWHFDCYIGAVKNFLYYALLGYSEEDSYLSALTRHGLITRTEASARLEKARERLRRMGPIATLLQDLGMEEIIPALTDLAGSSPFLYTKEAMQQRTIIKPHHFLDIIKLYGRGCDRFLPDDTFNHDFYLVGNSILKERHRQLVLVAASDDICLPCRFRDGATCCDTVTGIGDYSTKESWNAAIDSRLFDLLGLRDGDVIGAQELAVRAKALLNRASEIWRRGEEPESRTAARIKDLERGLDKFLSC
jgi:hypothetical protein